MSIRVILNKGARKMSGGRDRLRVGKEPEQPDQPTVSKSPSRQAGPRASGIRDGGRVTPCGPVSSYSIWMFSLCFHAPTISRISS